MLTLKKNRKQSSASIIALCVWVSAFLGVALAGCTNANPSVGFLSNFFFNSDSAIWMSGSEYINQGGTCGTRSVEAPTNVPGARSGAVSWVDNIGNFWLFGGSGNDCLGYTGYINDLWKYDVTTNQWAWYGGDASGVAPTYGTKGSASATNIPGARSGAVTWSDGSGNLWLFGGFGFDSAATIGVLNDLWKFSTSSGQWTWISGSNSVNQYGTYGTLGTAATSNVPGARKLATSWLDPAGLLWLFGGSGYDSAGTDGALNDLWNFNTVTGKWTWQSGNNTANHFGVYGTLNFENAANLPGGRDSMMSWIDSSGNLWLFGGEGFAVSAMSSTLNDLWKYDQATGYWVWVSGANFGTQAGLYGVRNTTNSTNTPGGRTGGSVWADGSGNFYLYGGFGLDGVGTDGTLNDMWRYNVASGLWTWTDGNNTANARGVYGALGQSNTAGFPGSRNSAAAFNNMTGLVWVFGGSGIDALGSVGVLNDLWLVKP